MAGSFVTTELFELFVDGLGPAIRENISQRLAPIESALGIKSAAGPKPRYRVKSDHRPSVSDQYETSDGIVWRLKAHLR